MSYSKGIMWLDDCRIPFVDGGWGIRKNSKNEKKHNDYGHNKIDQLQNTKGRFTPNLLVCDDMLNDGKVSKSNQKQKQIEKKHNYNINFGVGEMYNEIQDKGTNSRYYDLDLWFDKMLEKL